MYISLKFVLKKPIQSSVTNNHKKRGFDGVPLRGYVASLDFAPPPKKKKKKKKKNIVGKSRD